MNEDKSWILPAEFLMNTSGNNLQYRVSSPTVLGTMHADVEKAGIWNDLELEIFQFSVRGKPWANAIHKVQYIQNIQ